LTTVASHGEGACEARAAGKSIFSREDDVSLASGNAVTIVESFSGTESPAGATRALVTNAAGNGSASRPGSADVETLRNVLVTNIESSLLLQRCSVSLLSRHDGTQHLLHISNGSISEANRNGSSPGGLGIIDGLDQICSDGRSVVVFLEDFYGGNGGDKSEQNSSRQPGTYSPRHSDSRLLAIPTSWSRVADSNPD